MAQSRLGSTVESIVNIGSGMVIAFSMMQFILVPLLRLEEFTIEKNLIVTIILTVISMLRSFLWRRYFIRYWRG